MLTMSRNLEKQKAKTMTNLEISGNKNWIYCVDKKILWTRRIFDQMYWRLFKKDLLLYWRLIIVKHNDEMLIYKYVAAFSSTVLKLVDSCHFFIFSWNINFLFQPYFKDTVHINCFMLSHIRSRSRKRLVPERIFTSGLGQLPCVTEPQASC